MLARPFDDNPACNGAAKHALELRQMLADG
jgi:hypothetical protein